MFHIQSFSAFDPLINSLRLTHVFGCFRGSSGGFELKFAHFYGFDPRFGPKTWVKRIPLSSTYHVSSTFPHIFASEGARKLLLEAVVAGKAGGEFGGEDAGADKAVEGPVGAGCGGLVELDGVGCFPRADVRVAAERILGR